MTTLEIEFYIYVSMQVLKHIPPSRGHGCLQIVAQLVFSLAEPVQSYFCHIDYHLIQACMPQFAAS